jgi:hypothetical protein
MGGINTNEDIAINIIRSIREQINSSVCNVFHAALFAQRNARGFFFIRITRRCQSVHSFGGSNRSGRNDIRSHAQWTHLDGQVVRQGVNSGLCDHHVSLQGQASLEVSGADEDITTASTSGSYICLSLQDEYERGVISEMEKQRPLYISDRPSCAVLPTQQRMAE